VPGRLDIIYSGEDVIRVRDLAVIDSKFTLNIVFTAYNINSLKYDIADLTFETTYLLPKENYDFPIHSDDQWDMQLQSQTTVTGNSDYFDIDDQAINAVKQLTAQAADGESSYTGCDESYKINEVSASDIAQDYIWYCPAVRYNSRISVTNSAGFTIDWLLKGYNPAALDDDSDPCADLNPAGGCDTDCTDATAWINAGCCAC